MTPVKKTADASAPRTADSNLASDSDITPPFLPPVENQELTSITHEIVCLQNARNIEAHRIANALHDAANAVHAQDVHGGIQLWHMINQGQEHSSDAPVSH